MGRGRAARVYDLPFVAALYDLDVRLMSRPLWGTSLREQVRFAAGAIAAAGDGAVLEVPAGTGLVLQRAVRGHSRSGLLVAVDLSHAMLRRAARRLAGQAVLVRADVAHLPFRDGAFSAAHSGNGFHVFPDRAAAAADLARTLRPGGLAAITTWTDQGGRWARGYQRGLARLGLITPPAPAADHARVFSDAGLSERSSTVGGTLLRWTGKRA